MATKPVDGRAWGALFRRPSSAPEACSTCSTSTQRPGAVLGKFIRGDERRGILVLVMVYDRAYNYHLYNSYGVLCGIGTVSLANWSLPVAELGSRLSLDITLLLVSVDFKQVLNGELPPVSYLTILDHYALAIIAFVFLATWLHGLVGLAELEGLSTDTVEALDFWVIAVYTGGFLLYNLRRAAFVRTQLFFNDVMTDASEIGVHGFAPPRPAR